MPAFSSTRTFIPLALLAAVTMTCLQGAAFAGTMPMESTHRSVKVAIDGLNLANPAGVAMLDTRLRMAAKQVCAPHDYRDLRAVADRASCERTALERATAMRDVLVARAQAEQLAARAQPAATTN
jgi:UrcA family protein